MKRIEEFKAAKQISAYVILKGDKLIGRIQAHFGSGAIGITCTVNAWNFDAEEGRIFMEGRARGGGYDLFTAAISGMIFDGVKLYDHSEKDDELDRVFRKYLHYCTDDQNRAKFVETQRKKGISFANMTQNENKIWRYTSVYYIGGLDRLKAMGYSVIQAI